jgi:6-phosphogluconolactonase (cycloisomerase 2 family)
MGFEHAFDGALHDWNRCITRACAMIDEMLRAAVVLACCGCGRLHFDPLQDAGASTTDSAAVTHRFLYYPTADPTLGFAVVEVDLGTGHVTPVGSYAGGTNPREVVVDVASLRAYVLETTPAQIAVFAIHPASGMPLPVAAPLADPSLTSPGGAALGPGGRYLYVANTFEDTIARFSIDQGALTFVDVTAPDLAGMLHPSKLLFGPGGTHLYTTVDDAGGGVAGLDVASDGSLSAIPGSPWDLSPPNGPFSVDLALHPSGQWLFASDGGDGRVLWASIAADGALTPQTIEAQYGGVADAISFAPNGTELFAGNCAGGIPLVATFSVDAAGNQTGPNQTLGPNGCSYGVVVTPGGEFVYAGDNGTGISGWAIAAGGTLVAIPGTPAGDNLAGRIVMVDTSG